MNQAVDQSQSSNQSVLEDFMSRVAKQINRVKGDILNSIYQEYNFSESSAET